ncbi:MAG TPA: sigma-70 family RNA polymerase sigma factor [Rhodothermales bacterium]
MGLRKLLLRTRTGFERAVHRYRHRVYGYAYHMLGDADEAADVTQDVFMRLWSSRDTIDESRLLGWLLHVTRNACIDALRHRRTVRNVIQTDERPIEELAAADERPDADLEVADLQRQLNDALARLSEPHRSIVILREIQEMSYLEICAALNLPMSTVKVYLHRGRRMLRESVAQTVIQGE